MNKTDVVRRVARETRLSQRVVSDVIGATHRLIEETLRDEKSVTFPGFGTFQTSQRKGGKVKHVRTGLPTAYPSSLSSPATMLIQTNRNTGCRSAPLNNTDSSTPAASR